MEQNLYNIIKKYNNVCRLHMPGHKSGGYIKKLFGKAAKLDITELPFSDNLLSAQGIIKQAEDNCARIYGAKMAKFSTCGSTTAILSLLHSVKNYGSSIVIERNSHKSVYSGIILSGINPVILNNPLQKNGLFGHISANEIDKSLAADKSCIGAFITSPDYYGNFADIKAISETVKKHGRLLFVDASHGAHLPFIYGDIYRYCDVYICSPHKTLPALTPASVCFFNNENLYGGYLQSFKMFHTSSPSYPVLASIDASVRYMEKKGKGDLSKLNVLGEKYKLILAQKGFITAENDDFTKLIIGGENICGYDLYRHIAGKGIYCEAADERYVLAMFTAADTAKSYKKLCRYLLSYSIGEQNGCEIYERAEPAVRVMPYLQAFNGNKELLPIENAAGKTAACDAGLFPPSYPLVCSGELITEKIAQVLSKRKEHTFGLDNGHIFVVK